MALRTCWNSPYHHAYHDIVRGVEIKTHAHYYPQSSGVLDIRPPGRDSSLESAPYSFQTEICPPRDAVEAYERHSCMPPSVLPNFESYVIYPLASITESSPLSVSHDKCEVSGDSTAVADTEQRFLGEVTEWSDPAFDSAIHCVAYMAPEWPGCFRVLEATSNGPQVVTVGTQLIARACWEGPATVLKIKFVKGDLTYLRAIVNSLGTKVFVVVGSNVVDINTSLLSRITRAFRRVAYRFSDLVEDTFLFSQPELALRSGSFRGTASPKLPFWELPRLDPHSIRIGTGGLTESDTTRCAYPSLSPICVRNSVACANCRKTLRATINWSLHYNSILAAFFPLFYEQNSCFGGSAGTELCDDSVFNGLLLAESVLFFLLLGRLLRLTRAARALVVPCPMSDRRVCELSKHLTGASPVSGVRDRCDNDLRAVQVTVYSGNERLICRRTLRYGHVGLYPVALGQADLVLPASNARASVMDFIEPPRTANDAISAISSDSMRQRWKEDDIVETGSSNLLCTAFLKGCGAYEVASVIHYRKRQKTTDNFTISAPSVWQDTATIYTIHGDIFPDTTRLLCQLVCGSIIRLDVPSTVFDALRVDRSHSEYFAHRLGSDIIGPGRVPDHQGIFYFHRSLHPLQLENVVHILSVVVVAPNAVTAFQRKVCHQFLPQSIAPFHALRCFEYLAGGFVIPDGVDPGKPINTFIIAPASKDEALMTASSRVLDQTPYIPRRGEIYVYVGISTVFCAVFLREGGTYKITRVFYPSGPVLITDKTRIFAPCAWKDGASIVSQDTDVSRGENELYCRLDCGTLIRLNTGLTRNIVITLSASVGAYSESP
ncbi:hypothetical protein C8F04DRAFT_1177957 [Mycena alexandri]|uniref:Uncharacterized protein n=1 Tax=Mycena alexandri TaxID=1745969 RepID=A0AAD6T714_9AGAR|nr:hypothetical protein C8F04DRAFT_1177957 [Mycena alexandri]